MKDEIIAKLKQAGSVGNGKELLDFYRKNPEWKLSGMGNNPGGGVLSRDMETLISNITENVLKELKNINL